MDLPSEQTMVNYVIVMCRATVVIIQEVKRKGFLTQKEKLHIFDFLFFILNDFKQNIQLESDSNTNSTNNDRIVVSTLMIDNP